MTSDQLTLEDEKRTIGVSKASWVVGCCPRTLTQLADRLGLGCRVGIKRARRYSMEEVMQLKSLWEGDKGGNNIN